MPTTAELTKARVFLLQAAASASWVALLIHPDEPTAAARLNDIAGRLGDELLIIDRLIAAQP